MSNNTLILSGLVLVGCLFCTIALMSRLSDGPSTFDCSKPVPDGFALEVENSGSYRAVYLDGTELLSLKDNMTRCQALERAWDQYEYHQKVKSKTWKREGEQCPSSK